MSDHLSVFPTDSVSVWAPVCVSNRYCKCLSICLCFQPTLQVYDHLSVSNRHYKCLTTCLCYQPTLQVSDHLSVLPADTTSVWPLVCVTSRHCNLLRTVHYQTEHTRCVKSERRYAARLNMGISSANLCIRFHLQKCAALFPPKHTHTHTPTHTHTHIFMDSNHQTHDLSSVTACRADKHDIMWNQQRQYVSAQSLPFTVF